MHTDLHAAKGDWPVRHQSAFHSRSRGRRLRCQARRRRHAPEGRDRVGRAVVAHRLRLLHAVPHRMGDALRQSAEITGYSVDGTFAQYGLADPDYVGRLPHDRWNSDRPLRCSVPA